MCNNPTHAAVAFHQKNSSQVYIARVFTRYRYSRAMILVWHSKTKAQSNHVIRFVLNIPNWTVSTFQGPFRLCLHLNTDAGLLNPIFSWAFSSIFAQLTAPKYREADGPNSCDFRLSLKATKNVNTLEPRRYNYWRNTHRLRLTNGNVAHKNDLLFNSLGKH